MGVVELDEMRPGVRRITLNRPEVLNALDPALMGGVHDALAEIRADRSCRVVVLTGAGRGFCAGADLKHPDPVAPGLPDGSFLERTWGMQEYLTGLAMELNTLRQPVIAAVNGPAMGGGFGLALACDLRVAADMATFGAKFIKIGLSNLDVGISYFLPRLVGTGRALELMLTGKTVDAQEAERLGLVNQVVPAGELDDAVLALAEQIMENTPFGVWMTKEGFWTTVDAPSLRHAVMIEYRTQMLGCYSGDMEEAIRAFNEERPQSWRA